jgi:hypothetical protein
VLVAWGDGEGERASLAEAIERLRQALAKPTTARSVPGPRPPRTGGTKQAAVLALLRRPEGASGPQIIEATGPGRRTPCAASSPP